MRLRDYLGKYLFPATILLTLLFGFATASNLFGETPSEAIEQLKVQAEKGNAEAQAKLGELYRKGEGVAQNFQESAKWLHKAAEKGIADAQLKLGELYADGKGVAQNAQESVKWLQRAAAQGNDEAKKKLHELSAKIPEKIEDFRKALDLITR